MDGRNIKKQDCSRIPTNQQFYSSSLSTLGLSPESCSFKYFIPSATSLPQNVNERIPLVQYQANGRSLGFSDKNLPSRCRRRLRTIFSNRQIEILERAYVRSKYPDACIKKEISREANLPIERVQVWFQNKRTRDKRFKEEKNANKSSENEALDGTNSSKRSEKLSCSTSTNTALKFGLDDNKCPTINGPVIFEDKNSGNERIQDISTASNRATNEAKYSVLVQDSPSSTIERSCQQYLQSLGVSNMPGISPSFIRYLHQQLRMSPPDSAELLAFQQQQQQQQHLQQQQQRLQEQQHRASKDFHGERKLNMKTSV